MTRYLLFAGEYYYPSGGWGDFYGSYNTLEEAIEAGKLSKRAWAGERWAHVVNAETLKVVWDSFGGVR